MISLSTFIFETSIDYKAWQRKIPLEDRNVIRLRWEILVLTPLEDLTHAILGFYLFAHNEIDYITYLCLVLSACMVLGRLFKVVIAQRGGLSDNFAPAETETVHKRIPGSQELNDDDEIECVGVSSFIRNRMSMAVVWHADDDITPEISLDSSDLKFEGNETGEQMGESIELGFMKTFSKLNVGIFDSTEGERTTGELESTISQQLELDTRYDHMRFPEGEFLVE